MQHVKHLTISEASEWLGVSRNTIRAWIKKGLLKTMLNGQVVVPVIGLSPRDIEKTRSAIRGYPGAYGFILGRLEEYETLRDGINLKIACLVDMILCFGLDYGIYKCRQSLLRDAAELTSLPIAGYISEGLAVDDISFDDLKTVIERQRSVLNNPAPFIKEYIAGESRIAVNEEVLGMILAACRTGKLDKLEFTADAMRIGYILKAHDHVRAKPASASLSRREDLCRLYEEALSKVRSLCGHTVLDKYLQRTACRHLDDFYSGESRDARLTEFSHIPVFVFIIVARAYKEFRRNLNFKVDDFISVGVDQLEGILENSEEYFPQEVRTSFHPAVSISRQIITEHLGVCWREVACNVLKESLASYRMKKSRLHKVLLDILDKYDLVIKPACAWSGRSRKPLAEDRPPAGLSRSDDGEQDESGGVEPEKMELLESTQDFVDEEEDSQDDSTEERKEYPPPVDTGNSQPVLSMDILCYYLYKLKKMPVQEIRNKSGLSCEEIEDASKDVEETLERGEPDQMEPILEALESLSGRDRRSPGRHHYGS